MSNDQNPGENGFRTDSSLPNTQDPQDAVSDAAAQGHDAMEGAAEKAADAVETPETPFATSIQPEESHSSATDAVASAFGGAEDKSQETTEPLPGQEGTQGYFASENASRVNDPYGNPVSDPYGQSAPVADPYGNIDAGAVPPVTPAGAMGEAQPQSAPLLQPNTADAGNPYAATGFDAPQDTSHGAQAQYTQPSYNAQQPQAGMASYAGGQQQGQLSANDEQMQATMAHWLPLAISALTGGSLGWVGPLVLLMTSGQRSERVARNAKESLNFELTFIIVMVISLILTLAIIGIFTAIGAGIAWLVLRVMASLAVNKGEEYRYPLTIRFLK